MFAETHGLLARVNGLLSQGGEVLSNQVVTAGPSRSLFSLAAREGPRIPAPSIIFVAYHILVFILGLDGLAVGGAFGFVQSDHGYTP